MEYLKLCVIVLLCLFKKVWSATFSDDLYMYDDEDWEMEYGSGDDEDYGYDYGVTFPQRNASDIHLTTQAPELTEVTKKMQWMDNTGVIVGAVLGIVFGLVICGAVCYFVITTRRKKIQDMHRTKVLRSSTRSAGIYKDLATEEPNRKFSTSLPIHIYENHRIPNLYEYDSA